jgi:hypothetical protein
VEKDLADNVEGELLDTKLSLEQFFSFADDLCRSMQEVVRSQSKQVQEQFRVTDKFNNFYSRAVDYEMTVYGQSRRNLCGCIHHNFQ